MGISSELSELVEVQLRKKEIENISLQQLDCVAHTMRDNAGLHILPQDKIAVWDVFHSI